MSKLVDKVLVVVVTRDNPVLLGHMFESFTKFNPGYPCEYLIVDHESTNPTHLLVANGLAASKPGVRICTYPNNRVEVSFNKAYHDNPNFKYYFFIHDDTAANRDNWLKVYVDRLNSGHYEKIIEQTHIRHYPIGRVGSMHQPWRSYTSILGYPVQCVYLQHALKVMNLQVPEIFKFCDPDRTLVSNECLQAIGGLPNIEDFKPMAGHDSETYNKLCDVVNHYLPYPEKGIPPRDKYPAGQCWNKFTMFSEFLNSIEPLVNTYRTVGLEGDGFLEQVNGYDEPWGHNYVQHYGAPNMKQFLGRVFNTDPNGISKNFNNKIFLLKADKAIKDYFARRTT